MKSGPGIIHAVSLELVVTICAAGKLGPDGKEDPPAFGRRITWHSRQRREALEKPKDHRLLPIDPNGFLRDMGLMLQSTACWLLRDMDRAIAGKVLDCLSVAVMAEIQHLDPSDVRTHALRCLWASVQAKADDAEREAAGKAKLFGVAPGELREAIAQPFVREKEGGLEYVRIDVEAGVSNILGALDLSIGKVRAA